MIRYVVALGPKMFDSARFIWPLYSRFVFCMCNFVRVASSNKLYLCCHFTIMIRLVFGNSFSVSPGLPEEIRSDTNDTYQEKA